VLIGTAVDVVVKKQDSVIARLGITDIFGQSLILAFFTVIVWVLESVFEYAYKRLWRNLSRRTMVCQKWFKIMGGANL
jgi:ATP-binding cassette subfamily B protein